jgi:AcrR family transcriptional regulator
MAKTPKSGKSSKGKGAAAQPPEIKYPRRTERRRRTRATILEAAGDHFRRDGYGATTMQSIADSADVHVTTLFMHFNTKADLALDLVQGRIDALRSRAFEARGQTSFFEFFRDEAMQRAAALSMEKRPDLTFWNALQTDADLAFAATVFDAGQNEVFARFVAEENEIDREQDYRPGLVAGLLLSATDLAYRNWLTSDKQSDPALAVTDALAIAEPAARHMLGEAS